MFIFLRYFPTGRRDITKLDYYISIKIFKQQTDINITDFKTTTVDKYNFYHKLDCFTKR